MTNNSNRKTKQLLLRIEKEVYDELYELKKGINFNEFFTKEMLPSFFSYNRLKKEYLILKEKTDKIEKEYLDRINKIKTYISELNPDLLLVLHQIARNTNSPLVLMKRWNSSQKVNFPFHFYCDLIEYFKEENNE